MPLSFYRNRASSSNDAFKMFNEELEVNLKNKGSIFSSYLSGNGYFSIGNPLNIVGVIGGKDGYDDVYLIYLKNDEDETTDWYLQALEIVKETIEYVLSQEDKDKYYFHWSA